MKLQLYGNWKDPEGNGEPNAHGRMLVAWLSGEDLEPTAELLAILRAEFIALDHYRETMEQRVRKTIASMHSMANDLVPRLEHPAGPAEQYSKGLNDGLYTGYASGAAMVHAALLECAGEAAL